MDLKDKLKERPIIGAFLGFNSPEIVEILGYTNFDFVMYDNEHSGLDYEALINMIRVGDSVGLKSLIRTKLDRVEILKFLDAGGVGIQVPMIETKEDALKAVGYGKYSTDRYNKGLALSTRAANYGFNINVKEYVKNKNEESLISVQIETREAVENLDEILKVEDLDIVFIGPSDLSQSYGKTGGAKDKKMVEIMDDIIKRTIKSGKIPGIFISSSEDVKMWQEKGVKFFIFSPVARIVNNLNEFREELL